MARRWALFRVLLAVQVIAAADNLLNEVEDQTTEEASDWLNEPIEDEDQTTEEGSDWLNEPTGVEDQTTEEGSDWLNEPTGVEDQTTEEGSDWLNEPTGDDPNVHEGLEDVIDNPADESETLDVCMDDDLGNVSTANTGDTVENTSCSAGKAAELPRPKCDEESGCDSPLYCFDFRNLEDSIVPDPPETVKVTPYELEGILENSSMTNSCAVVMFYAPWCEFSVQFARKFNALGRSFDGLPILAVDLGENEPYKYVLAYLPVVAFYYRGRVLFKLSLSSTFEELRDLIVNVTGFPSGGIDIADDENESPVPTQREDSDRYFLYFATWWLVFVVFVFVVKSRPVVDCIEHLRSRIGWTKSEKVD